MAPTQLPRDPSTLPKHFDATAAEERFCKRWAERGTYHYDAERPREETFVVDTPPPTVSGSLHIGHVFSYTHTDVLVRQQRMRGKNIFYPMGWDDNGLPTERRVQNLYHVRCDPGTPYEPGLNLEPVSAKQKKERPRLLSRQNFIELCHTVTVEDEKAFMALWQQLGLSVDWRQQYATIDDHCRHVAQLSFLDLAHRGHVYSVEAPTMWDVDFQTAVAQAELEDRPKQGAFHRVRFGVEDSDESFVIATTRPELLPACVGVTAHPDDARFQHLFGKRAVTPVFHVPVPIFPSELADPEKGTGILMVCTFGDQTDVHWWRTEKLPLRQVLGRNGRFDSVSFEQTNASAPPLFPSAKPQQANAAYAALLGKTVHSGRLAMVELLRNADHRAAGEDAPLQGEPEPTNQAVKFFEKGDKPLEFITTRQWFVRLLDKKQALLDKGRAIDWHPSFMGQRFDIWTENLGLDWCISRQRYFGVPFPVWYPLDAEGRTQFEAPIFATREQLPIDPMAMPPKGFEESQRGKPGGFVGEPDVFDTWFTSSMSPQIGSRWLLEPARHQKLFPADIRPQSHEIIRTWAFYTIAKAMLHEDKVPWQNVVISGWVLDPEKKKMSKSKGNVMTPASLLENYGSDPVRYWAASARLGTDTAFDEGVLKVGKRLVTKLFNAGKFVLQQEAPGLAASAWSLADLAPMVTVELDKAFLQELAELTQKVDAHFAEFEFAKALSETESFFWGAFTDAYLELSKVRARSEDAGDAERRSAVAALRIAMHVLLRLFAPVLPFITEEVWSWIHGEHSSIHREPWPSKAELAGVAAPSEAKSFALASEALRAIHKSKSEAGVSIGRPALTLTLAASQPELLNAVLTDVKDAARCAELKLESAGGDEALSVSHAEFEGA